MPLNSNATLQDVINLLNSDQGINSKTELSSIIGSPAQSNETIQEQSGHLQTSKTNLINTLTSLGVPSTQSDSIQDLVNKVSNIPPPIENIQGTIGVSSVNAAFINDQGQTTNMRFVEINIPNNTRPIRNIRISLNTTEADIETFWSSETGKQNKITAVSKLSTNTTYGNTIAINATTGASVISPNRVVMPVFTYSSNTIYNYSIYY